jgi:hypothetical protein
MFIIFNRLAAIAGLVGAVAAGECGPSLADVPIGIELRRQYDAHGALTDVVFRDPSRPLLLAKAFLIDGGLSFDLKLEDGRGDPRALYGRDVVRLALHEFDGRVRYLRLIWLASLQPSDNLARYNELTGRGVEPDAAARDTWSGRMAARHGFTRARLLKQTGASGAYTYVSYAFERAEPPVAAGFVRSALARWIAAPDPR